VAVPNQVPVEPAPTRTVLDSLAGLSLADLVAAATGAAARTA